MMERRLFMAEEILVRDEGRISTILINRPDKKNALTVTCLGSLCRVLQYLSYRKNVPVVVLRGAGEESFCAGFDIASLPITEQPVDMRGESPPLEEALRAIENYPYPVIAMIRGAALGGGCELALGCDIRIGARSAVMGVPSAKLGLVYPHQRLRRFYRTLGPSRCAEILFTGRSYRADDCLTMGLVNHIVDDGVLEEFTYSMAGEIAANAPLAITGTKRALAVIGTYPRLEKGDEDDLNALFLKSLASADIKEARAAFFERRKPRFKGL